MNTQPIDIERAVNVGDVVSVVMPYGIRFGVVRSIDNAADDRTHYVELYTALGDGRYGWSGIYFAASQLTLRPDIPHPCVVLNALDSDMATLDADTISHSREQQERTLYYVNGY